MPEAAGSNPASPNPVNGRATRWVTGPAWKAGEPLALRVQLPPLPLDLVRAEMVPEVLSAAREIVDLEETGSNPAGYPDRVF